MNAKVKVLCAAAMAVVLFAGMATAHAVVQARAAAPVLAAIGDSLTAGYGANGIHQDEPAEAWATGTDPLIGSLATRAGATGSNFAVDGTNMQQAETQAQQVVATGAVDVAIWDGTNDVCTSSTAQMTAPATFKSEFGTVLNTLTSGLPNAKILVASIPDFVGYYQRAHTNATVVSNWQTIGVCPDIFGAAATDADRTLAAQQINDLNTVLSQTCALYPACTYDRGALFNLYPVLPTQAFTFDSLHLSAAGQGLVAAFEWTVGPFAAAVAGTTTTTTPTTTTAPTTTTTPTLRQFGKTTIGTSSDQPGQDYEFGSIYTLAAAGSAIDVKCYVQGGTSAEKAKTFIYAVSGGSPTSLLGVGAEFTVAAGQSAGWVTSTFPVPVALQAGSYEVGPISGPTGTTGARFFWDAVASQGQYRPNLYSQGPTSPWTGGGTTNHQMSCYVDVQ